MAGAVLRVAPAGAVLRVAPAGAVLRVAHLLPNMVTGGRERIVADLCARAPAAGIAPCVIAYDPDESGSARLDFGDTPVHCLDRRDPAFRTRLRTLLAAASVDVLHAQGHVAAAIAHGATGDVPMLATLHVALGGGWRWAVPVARGLRGARIVTAVSDDLARRYRTLAGGPIRTVPTGVDLARFLPAERAPQPVFTIGIAARLHPVKRHRDAIAALRILDRRGIACRLRIAGQGPLAAAIADRARGLDVVLEGHVDDMPHWLSRLDAFLLPSDHEGTPAALLEAMACALPCIATAVGGVPALAGDAALLVPRRDPSAIADAVAALLAQAPLRARLGAAAASRAQAFSTTVQAASYARLYAALARERMLDARITAP